MLWWLRVLKPEPIMPVLVVCLVRRIAPVCQEPAGTHLVHSTLPVWSTAPSMAAVMMVHGLVAA